MLLETIDAHVSGTVVRLITGGFPSPRGKTMEGKGEWVRRHAPAQCAMALAEPRGHRALQGAVLTEPVSAGANAGILCLDADGVRPASGEIVLAVATIAIERGLITSAGDGSRLTFDVMPGRVEIECRAGLSSGSSGRRAGALRFTGAPALVVAGAVELAWRERLLRIDLAFAGELLAIVDGENAGVQLDAAHAGELSRTGPAIAALANRAIETSAAAFGSWRVTATVFTGLPDSPDAQLRTVAVRNSGVVERSPSANALSSIMAVFDAMGLMDGQETLTTEGLAGTLLNGSIGGRTAVGQHPAIVPVIVGTAWVVGEHTLIAHADDPLREGLSVRW